MEEIKTLLQLGETKEALAKFRTLSEAQQEDFFRGMAPTLFPPPLIGVLFRKLKPGYTYQDFHKAWLPPLKKGKDLAHYFPYPTYVLSAQNKDDQTDVITIGFVWLEEDKLEGFLKSTAETEKMRHDSIAKVADKIGETLVYRVKGVMKLGS